MHTHQCPRCSLRFGFATELKDHLAIEHPTFHATAKTVEDDLLGACHCRH